MFKERDFNIEGKVRVTTSVKASIHAIAQANKNKWSDALEFGILFLAADQTGGITQEYPTNNLENKLKRVITLLNEKTLELEELKERVKNGRAEE